MNNFNKRGLWQKEGTFISIFYVSNNVSHKKKKRKNSK